MGRTGPDAGRGARRRALACRALRLRIFRAGWLNHVATRRCQSLWKCGFRIMPFRLGAMAAAYESGDVGNGRWVRALDPVEAAASGPRARATAQRRLQLGPEVPPWPRRQQSYADGCGWSPAAPAQEALTFSEGERQAERKRGCKALWDGVGSANRKRRSVLAN